MRSLFFARLLGVFLILPMLAQAQVQPLTRADADAWLDQLVPAALKAGDIAGGVIVIVKDGQVLTARGYGFADVAKQLPVDPAKTLFRPGSITKVFTWTAVMQLAEQGRIDLDADVNGYLDFGVPARDGAPVTMRQMMTHTAGFEEKVKGIGGPVQQPPLGDYLRAWVPERIFAAGTVPAYSNFASALAGYIVERVSGQPYDDYMDQHVFGPLGMRLTTSRQPLPAALGSSMSQGYMTASGPARYFEFLAPAPAGSMSATGEDMARFMIAHLQKGQIDSVRILSPESTERMHAIQPRIYPALNGMALGFYEHSRNGHRILAHNGGTQFFHSDLHLFLDDGVGLYVSLNSPGNDGAATGLHETLFHGFTDRYFPAAPAAVTGATDAATALEHARLMAGVWESSRRSASNILSIFGLLGPMTVSAHEDGTISFAVPRHGETFWREVAPFVWKDVNGPERVQAIVTDGRPVMWGLDVAPPAAFQRIPWWRSPTWMLPALGLSFLALLGNGLALPVAALRRPLRDAWRQRDRAAISAQLVRATSLAAALTFGALLGTLLYMAGAYDRLSDAIDPVLQTLKPLAVLSFLAACVAAWFDLVRFWSVRRGWVRRLWMVVIAIGATVLAWSAFAFHIANFSSQY